MTFPGALKVKKTSKKTFAFDSTDGPEDDHSYGVSNMNVLSWMGTMLEKFLTLPAEAFNTLLKKNSPESAEKRSEAIPDREAYQYSTVSLGSSAARGDDVDVGFSRRTLLCVRSWMRSMNVYLGRVCSISRRGLL